MNGGKGYEAAGILFFDVHGYSNLSQFQMEAYHRKIWPVLHESAVKKRGRADERDYLYKNTWGDGIVLIHEDHYKLALVALEWMAYFTEGQYKVDADPTFNEVALLPRIAMNYGEFQSAQDPFQNRLSYFGKEIIRAARIEPITEPGHVWVTPIEKEFIKRRQDAERAHLIEFIDRGKLELAKKFEADHLFEIVRIGHVEDAKAVDAAKEQAAEEVRPIDPQTAIRIQTIINKNPLDPPVNICSVDRQRLCPAKAESLGLIADVARDGESGGEELIVSNWIGAIRDCADALLTNLGREELFDYQVTILSIQIDNFLQAVGGFKRRYALTWTDRYERALAFLKHRCGTDLESQYADVFVDSIKNIQDLRLGPGGGAMHAQLIDAATRIQRTAPAFDVHLHDVGRSRIRLMLEAIREGFKAFTHLEFAAHLRRTIDILRDPRKRQGLPLNWCKETV